MREDEIQRDIKGSNNLFFNLMFDQLKETTQREVILSSRDSYRFLCLLQERQRDTATHPFPFTYEDDLDKPCDDPNTEQGILGGLEAEQNKFYNTSINKRKFPSWRCFVRASSSTRMFLTFLPASFDDLLKLNDLEDIVKSKSSSLCEDGVKDGSLGRSTKVKVDCQPTVTSPEKAPVSDKKVTLDGADDTDSQTNLPNVEGQTEGNVITDLEEKEMEDTVPDLPGGEEEGSVKDSKYLFCVVPLYVYECYLNNVTDSLINPWTFELAPDIYEDCTFETKGDSMDMSGWKGHFFRFPSFDRDSTPGSDDKDDYETLHQILRCSQSQERRMTESSVDGTEDLKHHCNFLSDIYTSCFVNGEDSSL